MSRAATSVSPPASAPAHGPLAFIFRPIFAPLVASRKAAAAIVALSAVQIVATSFHLPGWPCPFLVVTGKPCPGCGLSRACAALITGSPGESFDLHAFALPVLIALALLATAAVLPAPARGRLGRAVEVVERTTWAGWLFLFALIVYWLVRLVFA